MAFRGNVVCLVSDGITARYGTRSPRSSTSRRGTWTTKARRCRSRRRRSADLALNLAIYGMFAPRRFLELLPGYVSFAEVKGRAR